MYGIDLNRPIFYRHSSLRFFKENEHHISRLCEDDVLLLIFDGVLRFSEDGIQYSLRPGEYHIQRHGSHQAGEYASDAPKYLYVHFLAEWTEGGGALSRSGSFDCARLKPLMEELDRLAHSGAPYIRQAAKFYGLLSELSQPPAASSPADEIAAYLAREYRHPITLEMLCGEFHFSKNHIINLFKKRFSMSPVTYLHRLRLQKAKQLMEVTSDPLETIAVQCGFPNYSHFYRLFCRENGLSPEKWRKQKRLGSIL